MRAMCTVLVTQQIPTNCVQANDDKLRVLPHIIFYLSARRPQLIGNPGHTGPGFFSTNVLDISKPFSRNFDFNVSYSSCWVYSLIKALKLKKKLKKTAIGALEARCRIWCMARRTQTCARKWTMWLVLSRHIPPSFWFDLLLWLETVV